MAYNEDSKVLQIRQLEVLVTSMRITLIKMFIPIQFILNL